MLSGKAKEKAGILDHGRRWSVTTYLEVDILRGHVPLHLGWLPSLVPKFARITKAKAKATAQLIVRAKEEASTPTRAKAKDKIEERATASPDTEAKAVARRALAKADSVRARAKASTAWIIHIRNGLQSGISNGLESGLRHRQLGLRHRQLKQPRPLLHPHSRHFPG